MYRRTAQFVHIVRVVAGKEASPYSLNVALEAVGTRGTVGTVKENEGGNQKKTYTRLA